MFNYSIDLLNKLVIIFVMKNHIEMIRLKMGLTRQELAQALELSHQAIFYYEHGLRRPRLSTCYKFIDLAKKYGVSLSLEEIYPRDE